MAASYELRGRRTERWGYVSLLVSQEELENVAVERGTPAPLPPPPSVIQPAVRMHGWITQ